MSGATAAAPPRTHHAKDDLAESPTVEPLLIACCSRRSLEATHIGCDARGIRGVNNLDILALREIAGANDYAK